MLSDKAKEIIDGTFHKIWRDEMEAESRMDKKTYKIKAFFYMQELEDLNLPIDWDKVEKYEDVKHVVELLENNLPELFSKGPVEPNRFPTLEFGELLIRVESINIRFQCFFFTLMIF